MKNKNNSRKNKARVGRPSKYRPIFAKKLTKYSDKTPYFERKVTISNKNRAFSLSTERVANEFPTIEGFACQNDITAETCVNWAKAKTSTGEPKYPEFFTAYNRLKSCQKAMLLTNGLLGLYSGRFAIFVMKNLMRTFRGN